MTRSASGTCARSSCSSIRFERRPTPRAWTSTQYAATTLLVLELVGTFVFALSGAAAGIKHRLDLFGVLVVACATATAGGVTRDVLIGAVPPVALRDWRYLGVAVLAGLVVFCPDWLETFNRSRYLSAPWKDEDR